MSLCESLGGAKDDTTGLELQMKIKAERSKLYRDDESEELLQMYGNISRLHHSWELS